MQTNQGQLERLKMWIKSGPKYAMLLNMPDIDKSVTLSQVDEPYTGSSGYYRQEIPMSSWSTAQIAPGGNAEIFTKVKFGPFNAELECTHVAVCSSDNGSGVLYFYCPLETFQKYGEPEKITPGQIFEITIREEQI